jgi:hypothetical protein
MVLRIHSRTMQHYPALDHEVSLPGFAKYEWSLLPELADIVCSGLNESSANSKFLPLTSPWKNGAPFRNSSGGGFTSNRQRF